MRHGEEKGGQDHPLDTLALSVNELVMIRLPDSPLFRQRGDSPYARDVFRSRSRGLFERLLRHHLKFGKQSHSDKATDQDDRDY